ncbi:CpaE family protein [Anaerovibrio slackiae]|uniref:AAA family ATPase n=1 Tax=Anaerovibrio slackiae TaxID=2652309 RepID=UPI00386E8501
MSFLSPLELRSYFTKVNDKVSVLCGTKTPSYIDKVSIPNLETLIKMSKSLFKYLLIDVPAGFNPTSIAAAEMSGMTYVVSMLNGAYEVKHAQRALEIFEAWEDYKQRVKVVFTRVVPCNQESKRKMSEAIGYPVEAVVPNAYMVVSKAADNGQMALDLEPDSPLARSINYLAGRIIRQNDTGRGAG